MSASDPEPVAALAALVAAVRFGWGVRQPSRFLPPCASDVVQALSEIASRARAERLVCGCGNGGVIGVRYASAALLCRRCCNAWEAVRRARLQGELREAARMAEELSPSPDLSPYSRLVPEIVYGARPRIQRRAPALAPLLAAMRLGRLDVPELAAMPPGPSRQRAARELLDRAIRMGVMCPCGSRTRMRYPPQRLIFSPKVGCLVVCEQHAWVTLDLGPDNESVWRSWVVKPEIKP